MKHQSQISATWARVFCFLGLFLQASANASIGAPAKETIALDIQLQLEELLTSSNLFDGHTLGQLKKVSDFYSLRHYQPAWRDQNGLLERADELLHFIDNVHLEGVSTVGLHRNLIEQSRHAVSAQEQASVFQN